MIPCASDMITMSCLSTRTAYRRIVVYELGKVCCPGFTGKDCSTRKKLKKIELISLSFIEIQLNPLKFHLSCSILPETM